MNALRTALDGLRDSLMLAEATGKAIDDALGDIGYSPVVYVFNRHLEDLNALFLSLETIVNTDVFPVLQAHFARCTSSSVNDQASGGPLL